MFQQILSYIFLGAGILFGIVLLRLIYRDRDIMRSEQGKFPLIALMETIIAQEVKNYNTVSVDINRIMSLKSPASARHHRQCSWAGSGPWRSA